MELDEYLQKNNLKRYIPIENSNRDSIYKRLCDLVNLFIGKDALNLSIKVEIFLINDPNINACTFKLNDIYYIGLFLGAISELESFVQAYILENLPKSIPNSIALREESFFPFFEKDEIPEYILANYFANTILQIIVYHELGHICYGHLDSSDKKTIQFEANSNEKGNLAFQAKEFMADFFSIANSLPNYSLVGEVILSEKIFTENLTLFLISLYSLYIYFEKEERQLVNSDSLVSRTHPHPAVRLNYILDMIEAEVHFELLQIFKPDWINKNAQPVQLIHSIYLDAFKRFLEFVHCTTTEKETVFELSYSDMCTIIRQKVQNCAADLYEVEYKSLCKVGTIRFEKLTAEDVDKMLTATPENILNPQNFPSKEVYDSFCTMIHNNDERLTFILEQISPNDVENLRKDLERYISNNALVLENG